jgi:outer membrane protein assembly factor BamA
VELPIFETLFLGGEYSVRGYDIRSIGPRDMGEEEPGTGLVLGGNKSLLFNAEYLISIAGPVRLILFYDAGQIRESGQPFAFSQTCSTRLARGFSPTRTLRRPRRRSSVSAARSRPRRAPRSGSSCRC